MLNKDTFVHFLAETGALRFGDFITKSGRETPYFINTGEFRTGESLSKLASFYADAFVEHFKGKAENLFGPAYKGIPLCAATAMKLSDLHHLNLSFTYNLTSGAIIVLVATSIFLITFLLAPNRKRSQSELDEL